MSGADEGRDVTDLDEANRKRKQRRQRPIDTPARETPRAQAMKIRYAAQPVGQRSVKRLVEEIIRDQETASARAVATGQPPRKVQSFATVERQLREWSRLFDWVKFAAAQDAEAATEEQRKRDAARVEMNDLMIRAGRGAWVRTFQSLGELIATDERVARAWETAATTALRAGREAPPRPRLFVPAATLVAFGRLGIYTERVAMGEATEIVGGSLDQALPQIVEVHIATAPPPEPLDDDPPNTVYADTNLPSPPQLLARLATQPPDDLDDPDDDNFDQDEDEDDE